MPDFKDEKIITPIAKDYILHLIKEATEILDELSWRMHRKSKEYVNRGNALEEIIDTFKYTLGLAQVLGYSLEEFESEFIKKSIVVEQRFTQEQSLPILKDQPCVLLDIDGIISDYPRCYLTWITEHYGHTPTEYRNLDIISKDNMKRAYRQSGAKRDQPVLPGAKELLDRIHLAGINIILITMRPYAEYYQIYPDTLEWLQKNDLPYDAILWARDKGLEALQNFKHILLAIDDDDKNIELYQRAGIKSIKCLPPTGTEDLLKSGRLDELLGSFYSSKQSI
jgi:hypothetical protein